MIDREDELFSVRDILDSQIMSHDQIEIGRVADIKVELHDDGSLTLTHVITGPQALASRINWRLKAVFRWILHDHFEQRIPLSEIEQLGQPSLSMAMPAIMPWGSQNAGLRSISCAGFQEVDTIKNETAKHNFQEYRSPLY